MKKHWKPALILLVLMLLPSCAKKGSESSNNEKRSPIAFSLVQQEDEFDIHTLEQNVFITDRFDASREFSFEGNHEYSKPRSMTLQWSASMDDGVHVDEYVLSISEKEDMSNPITYNTGLSQMKELTNFKIHQDYYWNVTAVCGSQSYSSDTKHFATYEEGPRNLNIDGVTNVRDCGGWPIGKPEKGRYVKQGLLFRTARLNASSVADTVIEITDEGKDVMLNEMKIKSEIDLRKVATNEIGGITGSPLGETVNYISCPMEYDVSNLMVDNKAEVKHVFEMLSNEANYPMFFHCNIGTDRTGMISFLVLGLLGVQEEYLQLDYEFSSLATIGKRREYSKLGSNYVGTIKKVYGGDLSEQIRLYLNSIGVTNAQLDNIVRILGE